MMSGKGAEFMKAYMGALVKMNKTGTEYVRGIPVVKVFQQTVYSFKAFHDAIAEYADMAQSYAARSAEARRCSTLPRSMASWHFFCPWRCCWRRARRTSRTLGQLHVLRDIFGRGAVGQ